MVIIMESRHLFRSLASSGALVGAVACLFQVPPLWEESSRGLFVKAQSWKDELRTFTVVVDAGHGGDDGGTKGGGIQEKDGTLDIALRLEKALRTRGVKVRMTREDDHYLSLPDRCDIANGSRADAFVSIHLNASPGTDAAGIETYFSSKQTLMDAPTLRRKLDLPSTAQVQDQRSQYLAACVQRRAGSISNTHDRGCRDSGFYVVRNTQCPAVLVECGYLTSSEEAVHLKSNEHRDRIAAAIADGVTHFLMASKLNPRRGILIGASNAAPVTGDTRDAPD
jgi:N-acetylmuramoyl-L-alanine amidase